MQERTEGDIECGQPAAHIVPGQYALDGLLVVTTTQPSTTSKAVQQD